MLSGIGHTNAQMIARSAAPRQAVSNEAVKPVEEISARARPPGQETVSSRPSNPLSPESLGSLLSGQEDGAGSGAAGGQELTEEEKKQVEELKQTDREVRAHEQAHKTVGGPYAGVVSYQTVTGPDGREYAVAGEVQIDTSPVPDNPDATIRKMEIVMRAALAPAEPSPQDMQVAQQAQQTKLQAQNEARKVEQKEREESQSSLQAPDSGQTPYRAISALDPAIGEPETSYGSGSADDEALDALIVLFGQ